MEIRIPQTDATKFDLLTTAIEEENIRVNVSQTHGRRDGFLSIRATLTPAKPIEESRKFRGIGRGYLKGKRFPRAKNAICYHGHYAFMEKLFKTIPEAKLQSAMTRRTSVPWMTAANFKDVAYNIGELNIGSILEPQLFRDGCDCETKSISTPVECASCGEKLDGINPFYGDTGTYYEGKPMCETCYYEADVLATIFFNGDESNPEVITDSRNYTDGVFAATWHSTDGWRGYFDISSPSYTNISSDSILWGEESGLVEKKKQINALFQKNGIEYAHVVSRTSNLFANSWDVFVKNSQAEKAKKLLTKAGILTG